MPPSDNDIARLAVVRQFQQVAQDYQASLERQKQLTDAQARETEIQAGITARANDCYAAARVLDFDLIAALATYQQNLVAPETPIAPQAQQQLISPAKPIRDVVLDAAEAAFPEPVRAATLQKEIEKARGPLHYKTIGMTLYRLSKEGLMRRQGQKDWFFVPVHQRTKKSGVSAPDNFDDLLG